MIINKNNHYLNLKAFQKHLVLSCCSIRHFLFYNGHFSLRWLTLAAKVLKSHQIQTKNLYLDPKSLYETLV